MDGFRVYQACGLLSAGELNTSQAILKVPGVMLRTGGANPGKHDAVVVIRAAASDSIAQGARGRGEF